MNIDNQISSQQASSQSLGNKAIDASQVDTNAFKQQLQKELAMQIQSAQQASLSGALSGQPAGASQGLSSGSFDLASLGLAQGAGNPGAASGSSLGDFSSNLGFDPAAMINSGMAAMGQEAVGIQQQMSSVMQTMMNLMMTLKQKMSEPRTSENHISQMTQSDMIDTSKKLSIHKDNLLRHLNDKGKNKANLSPEYKNQMNEMTTQFEGQMTVMVGVHAEFAIKGQRSSAEELKDIHGRLSEESSSYASVEMSFISIFSVSMSTSSTGNTEVENGRLNDIKEDLLSYLENNDSSRSDRLLEQIRELIAGATAAATQVESETDDMDSDVSDSEYITGDIVG